MLFLQERNHAPILTPIFFLLLWIFGTSGYAQEQEQNGLQAFLDRWKLRPYAMIQVWGTYTHGTQLYNQDSVRYESVDNRPGVMLRRGRVGLRGEPVDRLKFNVMLAYDQLGQDIFDGINGGPNNRPPNVVLWDAFLQYQVLPQSDAFHITAGYFRPQLSRESITSGWAVNSMEKAMSQTYIRRHLTGVGPGRAPGINLGGQLPISPAILVNYNLGMFTPANGSLEGNLTGLTGGRNYSPLFVGRMVLNLGDPEMQDYGISYHINYFGERRGLSIGIGGATQGRTDLFKRSEALSADLLMNLGHLSLDGEINLMIRQSEGNTPDPVDDFSYQSYTGHARAGYTLPVGTKQFIEPVIMVMHFEGAQNLLDQEKALAVEAFSGSETTIDFGINWYLNRRKLKLLAHYTLRGGDNGSLAPSGLVNEYFNGSVLGGITKGNWFGIGLHAIF